MFNELEPGRWESAVDNLLSGEWKIRKLTPKECFRLQGISDEMFEKARIINSDSQLYKQAGNACSVNVVYEIARKMSNEDNENGKGKRE